MLTLVHPAPTGQVTDPPRRRKGKRAVALSLTADENRHLRASLRNLARAYGSWGCLAMVMGIPAGALQRTGGRRGAHPGIALRAAKAGGTTVESILAGQLTMTGRCKACGSSLNERRAAGGA